MDRIKLTKIKNAPNSSGSLATYNPRREEINFLRFLGRSKKATTRSRDMTQILESVCNRKNEKAKSRSRKFLIKIERQSKTENCLLTAHLDFFVA
jgi:hypothetical protein